MTEIVDRMAHIEKLTQQLAESQLQSSLEFREFKDEMKEFKDEMKEFKDEMKEFKDEMKEFKEDMKESRDQMSKRWGELANQLGKVVEDLIIPNIDILISKYFEEEIVDSYGRLYKRKTESRDGKEFDGIITTSKHVFLFEIKNQITQEHVNQFRGFIDSDEFFEYFDFLKGKKLVPVMGSINLKEHQVTMLTQENILALSIRGDILVFQNIDKIKI